MTPEGRCDWHKYWATVDDYAGMLHELISVSTGAALLALMMLCIGMCLKRTRAFSMLTLVYFVSYALALVFYQRYFPGAHGLRYLDLFTHLAVVTMVGFVLHLVSTLPAELSSFVGTPDFGGSRWRFYWGLSLRVRDCSTSSWSEIG